MGKERSKRSANVFIRSPMRKKYFTQRRKDRKGAKAGQMFRARLSLWRAFAPLRSLRLCVKSPVCAAEAAIVREDHGLRARPDAEFVEDVRHVIANSLFTDRKTLRDLSVPQTLRNQRQHFTLARR